jgi:hypothetical protein
VAVHPAWHLDVAGKGELMPTIYVSIGNSDDKLTQAQWSEFVKDFNNLILAWEASGRVVEIHGRWASDSTSHWQNAAWCFDSHGQSEAFMQQDLQALAAKYNQDSIAWAVAETTFIQPT